MIHPDTKLQFIDEEKGYGVIATKKIPKGTITWAHDKFDIIFSSEEVTKLEPIYQEILKKYTYRDQNGHQVLCWDFGRFVNHSFNANCMSTAYDFEIAIRDIEEGAELTNDYGYLNISLPFTPKDENAIRKSVFPDDVLKYYKEWDRLVLNALPWWIKVDQPLIELLSEEIIKELREVINGEKELKSILETYYHEPETTGIIFI